MPAEETREHFKERELCDESWGGTGAGSRRWTRAGVPYDEWWVRRLKQRLMSARNNFECRGETVSFESQ